MKIDKQKWDDNGFLLLKNLLTLEKVKQINKHYSNVVKEREVLVSSNRENESPLQNWRVVKPEMYWDHAKDVMLNPIFEKLLENLLGVKPLAAQTIYYYKPPGTPGQGLHWDNYYFEAEPYPCTGIWVALDKVDSLNGGLALVPGSHKKKYEIIDELEEEQPRARTLSGRHGVNLEPETKIYFPILEPGDAVVFNGNILHGSPPNKDKSRWRRSLACHYLPSNIEQVSEWYLPLTSFEGQGVTCKTAESKREKKGNSWKAVTCYGWTEEDPLTPNS